MTSGNGVVEDRSSASRARILWAPIPSFMGYEVSTDGQVRSVDRMVPNRWGGLRPAKGVLLKVVNRNGYRVVNIDKRPRSVHVLMMEAFVGPRPEGVFVRHLNDIRDDNRLSNLAYGTPRDNSQDALRNSRMSHQDRYTCPQGHVYDTTERNDRGYLTRRCKKCRNKQTAARQKRAVDSTAGVFEVARILEKPVAEVKSMMESGALATRKVGAVRRVLRSELPVSE